MLKKQTKGFIFLLVFVFGLQTVASPGGSNISKNLKDKQHVLLKSYNDFAAFPEVMGIFTFSHWTPEDNRLLQHSLASVGSPSLPPMSIDGNKFKTAIEGKTFIIESYDSANQTFFINQKLFKLDTAKSLLSQAEQLKKLLDEQAQAGRLFFEQAEAQGWEEIGIITLVVLIVGWVGAHDYLFSQGMNVYARNLDYAKACASIEESKESIQKMSKADFTKFVSFLPEAQKAVTKALTNYKKNCTTDSEIDKNSKICEELTRDLECISQESAQSFSLVAKANVLNRTDISEDAKNAYNANKGSFLAVDAQISQALGETPVPAENPNQNQRDIH